jgi:hypothetical protein
MEYTQEELNNILDKHQKWLRGEEGGDRADLVGAHLEGVHLEGACLERASLASVHLEQAHLEYAHLKRAYLRGAYLEGACLKEAYLEGAHLEGAHLKGINLEGAHLEGADIDFSCWPLWCGSKGIKVDRKIYLQLLAHLCAVDVNDDECKDNQQANLELARQSHIASELGIVE